MRFGGGSDGEARQQQATKTTLRIQSKRQTANSEQLERGIGGGKYRRCPPSFSIIDDIFDSNGAPLSSDRGCRQRGLVVQSSSVIVVRRCTS